MQTNYVTNLQNQLCSVERANFSEKNRVSTEYKDVDRFRNGSVNEVYGLKLVNSTALTSRVLNILILRFVCIVLNTFKVGCDIY